VRILRWLDDAERIIADRRITSRAGCLLLERRISEATRFWTSATQDSTSSPRNSGPRGHAAVTLQRPDTEEGNPEHRSPCSPVSFASDRWCRPRVRHDRISKRKSLDLLPDKGTDPKALKRFLQTLNNFPIRFIANNESWRRQNVLKALSLPSKETRCHTLAMLAH
jgi:hypothetical protein